jgi:hypothetical protein
MTFAFSQAAWIAPEHFATYHAHVVLAIFSDSHRAHLSNEAQLKQQEVCRFWDWFFRVLVSVLAGNDADHDGKARKPSQVFPMYTRRDSRSPELGNPP